MPEDMDIYMKKIKQRAEETDNVMGKIKADKMAELDKLRIENEMEEVKAKLEENRAKIRESQQTGQALAPQQAYNFAELLFTGRPPEEIKQIISSLTEEEIRKLAYMASAMNNNKLTEFREYMRQPSTGMKEVVETVKLVTEIAKPQQPPQGSISDIAKSMAEMFKTGVEVGRGQNPSQSSDATQVLFKETLAELKATREENARQERSRMEKEIAEIKSRPSAMAEITNDAEKFATYRKMFGGGDPAVANEYTLKKLEMEQTERLDDRKLGFEEKKWEYEKANEGKTMEQVTNLIKTVGEGPIGKAIENMGSGVGERLKTGKNNMQSLLKIQCPKCGGQFSVNPALQSVSCVHCGEVLVARTPPTTQSQPEPPPVTQEPPQQLDNQQTQSQEPPQQESSSVEATDQPPAQ